jgi:molybdopterin/thiamine biosynthesis adenylyltransferase
MLSTIRHEEIFSANKNNFPITLIGCGAIGSRVFTALAELGLNKITSYDFDYVELHNLCNQIYIHHDISQPKVTGLKIWYQDKLGPGEAKHPTPTMHFINEAVVAETKLKGTVFLMVDSMAAREKIFRDNIQGNTDVGKVIDIRMAATHGNIFTFNPHTQGDRWLETMFSDDDGEVSACGSSLTVGTTASVLANMAVWQYMHYRTNPEAGNTLVNLFLKPFILTTSDWK